MLKFLKFFSPFGGTGKKVAPSLNLSLMPAFFAAGCCATGPMVVLLGFAMSENYLADYVWHFRAAGLAILIISLVWYFKQAGITSKAQLESNWQRVLFISTQTAFLSLVIYLALIIYVVPVLSVMVDQQLQECCTIKVIQ